jgi:hypothetical protein
MGQITLTSADAADPAAYHAAARRALRAATARSAALLRSIADPAAPIPGSQWSVAEAAAHLVLIAQANAAARPAWIQAGAGILGLSVATARRRRAGRGAAA